MIPKMFMVGSAKPGSFATDAFNGALATALARSKHPFQVIRRVKEADGKVLIRTGSQPSLRISGELEKFMASSAPGLSPAVQTVVDSPDVTNTLS